MPDTIDPGTWPSARGPWPEVHDLTRLYDHGRRWCANAAAHPGTSGYPDPDGHLPWHECRSPEMSIDDVRIGIDGPVCQTSVYLAAPFRFGQLRQHHPAATELSVRVVIDAGTAAGGESMIRLSLSLGEAVRLARNLNHVIDAHSLPAGS